MRITKRTLTIVAAVAAVGLLGAGGVAAATGNDGADPQPTGAQADKAKQAALSSVGAGKVTNVSADNGNTGEKPDASDATPPTYESQSAWSIEVTKSDGSTVTVHLDKNFKVLATEAPTPGDDNAHQGTENAADHTGD